MEEQQTGRSKTVRCPYNPVQETLLPKRNLAVFSSTWSGGRLWKSPERDRAGGTAVYFFSEGMKSRYWICSITKPTPTEWRQAFTSRAFRGQMQPYHPVNGIPITLSMKLLSFERTEA